ncbi:MAG: ATP-binding protein [Phycisphaerales bacterium]|jgi:PAS domain S-box-containing protein
MNNREGETIHRILVIDDNTNIQEDFKTILIREEDNTELNSLVSDVLGSNTRKPVCDNKYKLDVASQGKEGYEKIKHAISENRPYELAFIDMRMPPGWDGLETIEHIWKIDPDIQIVICTAYSDHSWEDIIRRLGSSQNLLILKKPFDSTEVAQLATALTTKWSLARQASMKMDQLEKMVEERTQELAQKNEWCEKEIAERKKAEEKITEQNEFLNLILESLKHPFYVIDINDYTIKLANSMAQTGSLSEETTCYSLIHKQNTPCNSSENICPLEEIKKTKQPMTIEHIHHGKDGNPRDVEVHVYPVFDKQGNLTQIIEYCLDITERKQAEQEQDKLIKKVDNINKELKEFASIVSHDLKAPLRGIKTLANWILSDSADKLDEQANEQMNLLLERVERMYALIEGVLQYSRAGQEGKQVQVDLNNFVPEVINMVDPPKNITVTIDNKLPIIECEEIHIMQIFQNLLSNAIKYMDKPEGQIRVGCIEEDDFWKFSVADNGPGIEEKYFEKIFKMFHILPTSPDFEGTGVGLTVAMKIVKLYGGNIWVESKVGEGSTFFFTFPKQKAGLKNEKLETNISR